MGDSALEVYYDNALYKFTFDIDIDIDTPSPYPIFGACSASMRAIRERSEYHLKTNRGRHRVVH